MDVLANLALGFGVVLTPTNLLVALIGCVVGTAVGVLPGLGPTATISLLLPISVYLDRTSSIILMSGIYYGAMYGGSITSILIKIPGEAASVITCLDGYQMARRGRAGAALGISAFGSFFAGIVATIGIALLGPQDRRRRSAVRAGRKGRAAFSRLRPDSRHRRGVQDQGPGDDRARPAARHRRRRSRLRRRALRVRRPAAARRLWHRRGRDGPVRDQRSPADGGRQRRGGEVSTIARACAISSQSHRDASNRSARCCAAACSDFFSGCCPAAAR